MENNNQDLKLCPVCGAKNKAAYKYCNECGAPLNQSYYSGADASNTPLVYNNVPNGQNTDYNKGENSNGSANQPQYNGQFNEGGYMPYSPFDKNINAPYFGTPDFSGVSAKDVYEFTGEKPDLFYKLKIQHFSGKTGPFCWPLFILGLLLNFFGIGCWYLYHKMYKPAMGFFAAAFANLALKSYTTFLIFDGITSEQIKAILNSPDSVYDILADYINSPTMYLIDSVTSIIELSALALTIVLPFFAYKQYKNFAIAKIYEQYSKSPLPNIAMAGGSRGGMVAIASVVYAITFFVSFIISIIPFVGTVIKVAEEEIKNQPPGIYEEMPFEDFPFDFEQGFPFD